MRDVRNEEGKSGKVSQMKSCLIGVIKNGQDFESNNRLQEAQKCGQCKLLSVCFFILFIHKTLIEGLLYTRNYTTFWINKGEYSPAFSELTICFGR